MSHRLGGSTCHVPFLSKDWAPSKPLQHHRCLALVGSVCIWSPHRALTVSHLWLTWLPTFFALFCRVRPLSFNLRVELNTNPIVSNLTEQMTQKSIDQKIDQWKRVCIQYVCANSTSIALQGVLKESARLYAPFLAEVSFVYEHVMAEDRPCSPPNSSPNTHGEWTPLTLKGYLHNLNLYLWNM